MELRLMIVDNEEKTRRELAESIPWEAWGYRVCAVCQNGDQALKLLDRVKPQVVLSNIRVPVADGTNLLQWIHRNRPGIRVVIFSCYTDFQHLNLAIKNQVTDYLLKPLDAGAIREVFQALHQKMEAEQQKAQDIEQSVEFHFEQWLCSLLKGTAAPEDTLRFSGKADARGIDLQNCYLAAIHPDGREGEERQSCRQFEQEVRQLFNSMDLPVSFFCMVSEEGQMAGIFSASGPELTRDRVASAARMLQARVRKCLNGSVSLGISNYVDSVDGLPQAWKNALCGIRQGMLQGSEALMFYEAMDLTEDIRVPCFSPETVEGYLLDGDDQALQAEISRVFQKFREEPMLEYRVIDRLVLSLLFTVELWAARYEIRMDEILRSLGASYEDIYACDTLVKKKDFLFSVLFAVQLQLEKQRSQSRKGTSLAYQVRELIEREFDNCEMSLDYIALKLSKHPSYISKIFKKELQCNFNDYLNRLRIEKAEQLLMLPEKKVYEIARACGYVDTSHFNRVFRKYKGVSPSEYREALTGSESAAH